jgi:autotransporter-associated beta strand protein
MNNSSAGLCKGFLVLIAVLAAAPAAKAQTTYTWGANGGTAWATGGNWVGGVAPGSSADPLNNDIAEWGGGSTGTQIQMNFGTLNSPFYVGTLNILSSNTVVKTMGANTSTAGIVQLNGTGANNLILSNASSSLLTLAPLAGGSGSGMSVRLGATNSTISGTGNIAISANITEAVAGSSITKTGTGTLTISGTNSYTGGTTVNAGILDIRSVNNNAGGAITLGDLSGTATATLTLGSSNSWNSAITVRSGSSGTKTIQTTTSNTPTLTGPITLNDDLTITRGGSGGANNMTVSGGISIASGKTLTLRTTSTSNLIIQSNAISGDGSVQITSTASGLTTFSAANTYTGGTTVAQGTLVLSGGSNRLLNTGSLTIGSGTTSGTLRLDGISQTVANLATSGTGTANAIVGGASATATLTVNLASGESTYAGVIGGGGTNQNNIAFTKAGSGTLILSGNHTHAGGTTVGGGVLVLSGNNFTTGTTTVGGGTLLANRQGTGSSTGSGNVTVQSGGTLGGNGRFGAMSPQLTTIQSGGLLTAGTSLATPALLTLGNVSFEAGSSFRATLFGTGATDISLLNVSSDVITPGNAALRLDLSALSPTDVETLRSTVGAGNTRTYTVVNSAGGLSGNFGSIDAANSNFGHFSPGEWSLTPIPATNMLQVDFTPVPEPAAILGLAALGSGFVRRLRSRKSSQRRDAVRR